MKGSEIREIILKSGLKLWQVADKLGLSDCNFSRRLRYDFSDSETQKILNIISELKEAE